MHKHLLQFKAFLLLVLCTVVGMGAYAQTVVLNETFDNIAGTGGNDGSWSGSAAGKAVNAEDMPTGWTYQNAYAGNGCVRLSTAKKLGSITTPDLSNLSGNATLTFRAGAWNGGSEKTTIKVSITGGAQLSGDQLDENGLVTLVKGQFTEYTLQITGGTSSSQITFEAAQASNNRFFLDDVKVVAEGGTTPTQPQDPELSFPQSSYTATLGQPFTGPVLTNPHDVAVVYLSSDPAVAEVDEQGNVTLLAAGTTTITATSEATEAFKAGSAEYTLTVNPAEKADAELAFSAASVSATLGEAFTAPTLTNPHDLAVTYKSSNPDVATVDEQGNVTLVAAGTTTITATSAETDTYAEGNAQYTLTVREKGSTGQWGVLFYEPFDGADGIGGNPQDQSVYDEATEQAGHRVDQWYGIPDGTNLTVEENNIKYTKVRGWEFVKTFRAYECIKLASGKKGGSALTPAIALLNGKATLSFRAGGWEGDGTMVDKVDSVYASTLTVSIVGDGTFEDGTTSQAIPVVEKEWNTHTFNIVGGTSTTRIKFACDAKNRLFLDDVKVEGERTAEKLRLSTTTNEGYGTYYAEKAFTMPAGLVGNIVTDTKANGELTLTEEYPAGSIVPANTALLLKGEENEINGKDYEADVYTGEVAPLTETNYLHGLDAVNKETHMTELTDADGQVVPARYYVLDYNQQGKNLGFYYFKNDTGAAVLYQAPFAFLALPEEMAASKVRGFAFDMHPTDITTVVNGEANQPAVIYTITGVRVNASSVNGLERGLYIVNGKKVLVK